MKPIDRLLAIMADLRDKNTGCPWDIEQDFKSIVPHTLEEAYEVADAVEKNDMQGLREELGDLLLQVVFHAQMAKEQALFTFDDVAEAICAKLIHRHPHIFGSAAEKGKILTAHDQAEAWDRLKALEKKQDPNSDQDVLAGVPLALPGLTRAVKLQKRAAKVGFDWASIEPVFEKLSEEIQELHHALEQGAPVERLREEIGDMLFCCANLARKLQVDAEEAIRACNHKFERRFHYMQGELGLQQRDIRDSSLQELNDLWDQAKIAEQSRLSEAKQA